MIKLMVEFEMYDSVKRFGEQVRQKRLYTQVHIVDADYVGGRASRFLARVLGVSCFPSQLTECQIKRPCNSWIYLLTGIWTPLLAMCSDLLIILLWTRNAYGSQVDSFEADLSSDESIFGSEPLRAILIRAPMITKVCLIHVWMLFRFSELINPTQAGPETKTLVQHNGNPVLLQQVGRKLDANDFLFVYDESALRTRCWHARFILKSQATLASISTSWTLSAVTAMHTKVDAVEHEPSSCS